MIRVFDFRCPHGHTTERFVDDDCRVVTCMLYGCTEYAHRLVAAPRAHLEGITGAFPSAADKWEKNRESHMRKERGVMERHGEYLNGMPSGN